MPGKINIGEGELPGHIRTIGVRTLVHNREKQRKPINKTGPIVSKKTQSDKLQLCQYNVF